MKTALFVVFTGSKTITAFRNFGKHNFSIGVSVLNYDILPFTKHFCL